MPPAARRFYKSPSSDLYLGDAVEIMNQLPPRSVDMVFADPPYGLSNGGTTCHGGKRVSVNKGSWDKSRGPLKDFEFHKRWLAAAKRILKDNGTLWVSGTYHSIYICGYALQSDDWHILNEIVWYKPNAAPNLACRMFAASHETIIWARKDKKRKHHFDYKAMRNGPGGDDFLKKPNRQMRSVWAINTPKPFEKIHGKHPTQKPLNLLHRIILAATEEGELVLDPFCGSATCGVAAIMENRRFIGIDNHEPYLKSMAIPRLAEISATMNLQATA